MKGWRTNLFTANKLVYDWRLEWLLGAWIEHFMAQGTCAQLARSRFRLINARELRADRWRMPDSGLIQPLVVVIFVGDWVTTLVRKHRMASDLIYFKLFFVAGLLLWVILQRKSCSFHSMQERGLGLNGLVLILKVANKLFGITLKIESTRQINNLQEAWDFKLGDYFV